MIKKLFLLFIVLCSLSASAETYDFSKQKLVYPYYFDAEVADGNYRVTVVVGSKKYAAETCLRAENRRLMEHKVLTKKGEFKTISFIVNKRSVDIPAYEYNGKEKAASKVKIKSSEVGSFTWDDKLTIEVNGGKPAVKSITIEPETSAVTVFLCGNSTVVDQGREPWASWGQMFPVWFNDKVCIANYGESGLTAASFLAQNRLEKILSCIKPGDYVFCEFGHNDEKEKGPGTGAWYHYSVNLKKFVDMVRAKDGDIIFCTPTVRRFFEKDGTLRNTHGDFPAAMKAVAQRENVPLIDLNAMTKTLFEAMGEDGSKNLLVHYKLGSFPWQEKEFADNTHFNPFGAFEVSKCIVMGLKQLNSPLLQYLRPTWQDFNPAQPDDWQQFYWPQSKFYDSRKPDGN